jgi:hypothetical protein
VVVYLTPKIERVISLLSASPVGEAQCQCCKVCLTRIDYYYYYYGVCVARQEAMSQQYALCSAARVTSAGFLGLLQGCCMLQGVVTNVAVALLR